MCTVTWLERGGCYDLFCSRDELRTRGAALAPRLHRSDGGSFLAPVDSDAGGTWIAVNDRGLGLSLLNDYAADQGRGDFESRGRLVRDLAAADSPAAAADSLRALDLGRYRPFRLVVVSPGVPARVHHWDGRGLDVEPASVPPLLTSSSFDSAGADRARRTLLRRFATERLGPDELLAFHRSHQPERGPLSPCMHRVDARTVSFTRLEVSPERALMSYHEGPPCLDSTSVTHQLELRGLPAAAGA